MLMVPYKSVAAALILAILFGPVGVFYSSFLGGVIMSIFGLVSIGTMASMRSPLPMATVWLFGIIWSMAAVRYYNRKMLKVAIYGSLHVPEKDAPKKTTKSGIFFRKKAAAKNETPSAGSEVIPDAEEASASWKL